MLSTALSNVGGVPVRAHIQHQTMAQHPLADCYRPRHLNFRFKSLTLTRAAKFITRPSLPVHWISLLDSACENLIYSFLYEIYPE